LTWRNGWLAHVSEHDAAVSLTAIERKPIHRRWNTLFTPGASNAQEV
jgi:hypothetical protein